ncbi:MAG: DNA polymerase III subunit gamma/tau [Parachlamydiaceae bacterium]|nr:DNA polymerase III subunit gamma/tau [Parachlamydiaceae bacterium]
MAEYQVLARRYRPQTFAEVFGQEAIVTTLKNAILHRRLAHAYLFCGSRGTGKTTLARVFAKALNCKTERKDLEPCNQCSSCREITLGSSMDVLEIDGASNRGIDDVRQITETVSYAAAGGGYKIYIIDEVHMLTKEAFNALLKTLEEPPPRVIFFFATTEPHKVPATILSRCQRFNLQRISAEKIVQKLTFIAEEQKAQITEEALLSIAARAEGGMRDAESLLDQILAFHEGCITAESVAEFLGVVSRDLFFSLDQAAKEGHLATAFEIAHQVFSQGKDLLHFVESLTDHYRTLLLVKVASPNAPFLTLSAANSEKYAASAKIYTQEQCLLILDFLVEAMAQIRFMPSSRIALEALLLRILRVKQRIPVEFLIRQLQELEQGLGVPTEIKDTAPAAVFISQDQDPKLAKVLQQPALDPIPIQAAAASEVKTVLPSSTFTTQTPEPEVGLQPVLIPLVQDAAILESQEILSPSVLTPQIPEPKPIQEPVLVPIPVRVAAIPEVAKEISSIAPAAPTTLTPTPIAPKTAEAIENLSMTIDPSPTPQELGIRSAPPLKQPPKVEQIVEPVNALLPHAITAVAPVELGARPTEEAKAAASKKQSRYDTLLHFAAVELEGSLQKTITKGF